MSILVDACMCMYMFWGVYIGLCANGRQPLLRLVFLVGICAIHFNFHNMMFNVAANGALIIIIIYLQNPLANCLAN